MSEKDGVEPEGVVQSKKGDRAEVARVLAWRKQHPDRYRETQRNLMRKRRVKAREGTGPDSEGSGGQR
jgi:hypothetical protein